jgi:monofunctional glycosyltransferase
MALFKRILKITLITLGALFMAYAIVFSIIATYLVYKGYQYVMQPFRDVQTLVLQNPNETSYMTVFREQLRKAGKPDTLLRIFVPLDSISPILKQTVIAAEDDGFYVHPGFDIEAILSAHEYNMRYNKIKRGGSTITQQLAKNLFLSNTRSFERKFKELAYTLLMEKYLGKDRILELYLNYAQWGPNLFGCEAASQFYFKKPSKKLSYNEAVRLAAVLVSPERLSPNREQSTFLSSRVQVIANNLYLHHQINDSGYESLTGSPPPDSNAPPVDEAEDSTAN